MHLFGLDANMFLNGLAAEGYQSAPGVMRLLEPLVTCLASWTGLDPQSIAPWLTIILPLLTIAILMGSICTIFPMFAIWLERKVSAHMQSRLGPMEVGWHGFLQSVADGVKLLAKEDIIPKAADKVLFILGPILAFTGIFILIVVLPFGPFISVSDMHLGIIFLAAVGSLEVIGILMAGWGSNNKWSLFGTMRLATQLVSYEIPLGLCLLTAVLVAGSFQLGAFNGQWQVGHYQQLDGNGQPTGKRIAADIVQSFRAAQKKSARKIYQRDLDTAVLGSLQGLDTPSFVLNRGSKLKTWEDLFREPVKEYRNAQGEVISVPKYMAEVRIIADANKSRTPTERATLVAVHLRKTFGKVKATPFKHGQSSVLYSVNGAPIERSVAMETVRSATELFQNTETEQQRVTQVTRHSLKAKFGSIKAVGKQTGQSGFIWNWYLFRNPFMIFMFIIFFTASLAENKRAPFDLPEAESELVSGFHTEYSGMRFSIFFLAEYIAMFVVSLLAAVLFCGGWNSGLDIEGFLYVVDDTIIGNGSQRTAQLMGLADAETWRLIGYVLIGHVVLMAKTLFFVFVQMWLRWTLPRVRLDHVMDLCLKVLLPFSLAGLVLVACWELAVSEVPLLQHARFLFFGVGAALVLAWAGWFWTSFQAPLNTSMQEKPWDTSGAFLK
jgi:NADH:ubiquinone oxidoreductase subunit H